MAEHAAIHCGEKIFQILRFGEQLLFVGMLLGDVYANAHRAHHAAIQIIKRGFVGGEQAGAFAGLHSFLGNTGFAAFHYNMLGFNTSWVVLLNIPDVSVAASLHLLFGFVYGFAKAVINFFVNTILGFVPNQVWDTIDSCFQKLAGLPGLFFLTAILLPTSEMEISFHIS